MKKISICLFAAAALLCAGCEDGIPEPGTMEVPAESVVLDEELSGGLIMEVGETRDVALKVKVLPENATDLAELFYSSNVEVATVSPKGVITAQKAGITMISIYVSGIETYFAVTVVDQIPIDIESIVFSAPTMNAYAGVGYNLLVSVEPFDQNEGVVFSSSDPEIASVNAETGRMICHRSGSVTITAAARNHPEVKASIEVTVTEFYGDWDRSKWSMSFSHGWKADNAIGSSATAAIDGNASTTLSMDRPGRNGLSADDVIWFQIDRGENPGKVNYLRIHHRPEGGGNKNILVRWFGFNRIEGSNDGTNFEVIAERVELTPDPNVYENLQTDNVPIPENDYRYLRFSGWNDVKQASPNLGFYCARGVEYGGINPGNTIQINEIYLGRAQE
ncbi:MAG: Ig-like domain-containing protein [Alistipes senegalensis]